MVTNQVDFSALYAQDDLEGQRMRYERLAARFGELFQDLGTPRFFSAPGRMEISGNHTDHQLGRVLAASVNLDTIAAAQQNGGNVVRVYSEGFAPVIVPLENLSPRKEEMGTTASIIRGCAAYLKEAGYRVGGFDAAITSNVLIGSGLSSSAAFEILINRIFDCLFNAGDIDAPLSARIAQKAENNYFGKPSGLMDQMACAVGGMVAIDFKKPEAEIEMLSYDFSAKGFALANVGTDSSHDDLTDAYAAIPEEMHAVAHCFGEEKLRFVPFDAFYQAIPSLRAKLGDRAVLRALHFFDENERVLRQVQALRDDDLQSFLRLTIASGESSWKLLQNVVAFPKSQPLALALALSQRMLEGRGAWRVHGGGFAGTILGFVPHEMMAEYKKEMDAVFGDGACRPLYIRPVGSCEVVFPE